MIHEIAYASTFHDNTCMFLLKAVQLEDIPEQAYPVPV